MEIEKKLELFKKRPTEEIVTEELLLEKLKSGERLRHYIGFELSGLIHIGTIATVRKAIHLKEAGVEINIFFADYHSWINKKLGGNLDLIRKVAFGYFKPMFECLGVEANYILASEIYDEEYWKLVLQIGNNVTLSRVKRALTIMGRKESESNPASFIIYPLMQAADIFKLDVDIAHAGMDQRKVHMLAIDVAEKLNVKKPVALHTHLLPSLQNEGRMDVDAKMSKSKEKGAIFIHDSEEEIKNKIMNAYCPKAVLDGNPVIDILKYVLILDDDEEFTIERDAKFGGDVTFTIPEFEKAYAKGEIHPLDVKRFVAERLTAFLSPARKKAKENSIKEMIRIIEGARSR